MVERAGRWFLHSGIQSEGGGVARYYRSDLGVYARVSTEITGYAVSFLLLLFERTGESVYRERALRAARFLTRTAYERKLGLFPFEHASNGDGPCGLAYFFDTGIIVRGLLKAWRATREAEFLDVAVAAGRTMMGSFCRDGVIHPVLSLPGREPLPFEPRWSRSPGCYQLKAAMAFEELFAETGEREFREAYDGAVDLALLDEARFLPGESDSAKVMDRLHAYLYFLEGLLPGMDREGNRAVLRAGVSRVAGYLGEIGPTFARSDVYAQLLRVRVLSEGAGGGEWEQLAGFQLQSEDGRVDGGFSFGRKDGVAMPYVNPVSTVFAVQALVLQQDTPAHDLI